MDEPVGVKDRSAALAGHRLILDLWQILSFLQRGVEGRDRDDGPGGLQASGRPSVPGEPNAYRTDDQKRHWNRANEKNGPSLSSSSS